MKQLTTILLILFSIFGTQAHRSRFLYRNEQGRQGVIDDYRNVLILAQYDTLVVQDTLWIDWAACYEYKSGKNTTFCEVDGTAPLNRFGYIVKQNGLWGFASAEGKILVPIVYDTIWPCKISHRYIVQQKGKCGMVDCESFAEIFPCEFDSIVCRRTDEYLYLFSDNDSTYLIGAAIETFRGGRSERHNFPAQYTPWSRHEL